MSEGKPLRTAIVGAGRMGRAHAQVLQPLPEFELAAVCDLNEQAARELATQFGNVTAYGALGPVLEAEAPEVAIVTTPGSSHCELTVQAAGAGVRGICCEKPMATSLGEGRRLVTACRRNGVELIVAHQRRMGADLLAMRRLIERGAVGEPYLLRGTCAGDMLGDGTHLIDSLRWLAGDEQVRWLLGQVYREPPQPGEPRGMGHVRSVGYRYGYPLESGAMATFEFEGGLRAELLTGDVRFPGRSYQDYEVFGTGGRLWRPGDDADPPLLIWDLRADGWREAPIDEPVDDPRTAMYRAFADTVRKGSPHPLAGDSALQGLELIMAVHESARTSRRIELPLQQEEFPLQLMIDSGRLPDSP